MSKDDIKLLPCPECGSIDLYVDYVMTLSIKCNQCGFTTGHHKFTDDVPGEWNRLPREGDIEVVQEKDDKNVLPCPVCGSDEHLTGNSFGTFGISFHNVGCGKCQVYGNHAITVQKSNEYWNAIPRTPEEIEKAAKEPNVI